VSPFGGPQIEEAELREASDAFKALMLDLQLSHAGTFRRLRTTLPREEGALGMSDGEELEWMAWVRSWTLGEPSGEWESAEEVQASIDVQAIVSGRGREHWSWRLGSDGVVRRVDLGDRLAKAREKRELGLEPEHSMEGILPREQALILQDESLEDLLSVRVPAARLERDMGLNDQPVGATEVGGLRDFLLQPGMGPLRRRS
jgi:hypothetical protein